MSGIPSISERYAVLGNRYSPPTPRRFEPRVSLVVLCRGPWMFRPQVLAEFAALGFLEILCFEAAPPRYDVEAVLRTCPGLRVFVDWETSNPGAWINRAAREVRGERFLVVWDDQTLPEPGLMARIHRLWQERHELALVPDRRDRQGRELPSLLVPVLDRDRLKILSLGADEENVDTLFPADYTALYDRSRFLQSGGFDPSMDKPFWQRADWGLRCRLWGERLCVERGFRVDYRSQVPVDDQTTDRSYPRFFLRNLAVRHAGDHGVLPWSRFWSHASRSGLTFSQAFADFRRQRDWVRLHRYRFQTDARVLTELWGSE